MVFYREPKMKRRGSGYFARIIRDHAREFNLPVGSAAAAVKSAYSLDDETAKKALSIVQGDHGKKSGILQLDDLVKKTSRRNSSRTGEDNLPFPANFPTESYMDYLRSIGDDMVAARRESFQF